MKVVNWSFGVAMTVALLYIAFRTFVAFQMMGFIAFVFGFMMSIIWISILGSIFVVVSVIARAISKR